MRNSKKFNQGITLIALVVTIVVLLILAGITISYVMDIDNSILNRAIDAKLQTDIAQWKERLELAKVQVFIQGKGTFNIEKYFDYIEQEGIINNKETDVVDNEDGTYDVTTKPGYIFEITLIPSSEKPTDAEITYIGQAEKMLPVIKKLEVSATQTSITGKATVSRLGNGTIKYYYKLKTENDSEYKEITNVNDKIGATQSTGIVSGTEYVIKVVAKNDAGEVEKTEEITATKVFVESVTLNKTTENVNVGKTVTLTVTVKPDDTTNKTVKWESSNTAIATVSNTGVVTGKKEGKTTITVTTMDGSNKTATCTVTVLPPNIADILGNIQSSNTTVIDQNGNRVVVPGGFKVLANGTSNVKYNYDTSHKPCVQDGIVIQDAEGNQFVWIPVGNIKNKNNTTTAITLGRYEFNATNGTPTLKQNATNYSSKVTIDGCYQELTSDLGGNTAAKNLSIFISKTNANGGYYLGRYEASRGTDGKVDSQANKYAWAGSTQLVAATAAREMYSSSYVDSDLINSYSWDTAIVFIQKYSNNSNYSNRWDNVTTSPMATGATGDVKCNIYEMAMNYSEITSEYSTTSGSPCVYRGGNFKSTDVTTASRKNFPSANKPTVTTFRPLLYLK